MAKLSREDNFTINKSNTMAKPTVKDLEKHYPDFKVIEVRDEFLLVPKSKKFSKLAELALDYINKPLREFSEDSVLSGYSFTEASYEKTNWFESGMPSLVKKDVKYNKESLDKLFLGFPDVQITFERILGRVVSSKPDAVHIIGNVNNMKTALASFLNVNITNSEVYSSSNIESASEARDLLNSIDTVCRNKSLVILDKVSFAPNVFTEVLASSKNKSLPEFWKLSGKDVLVLFVHEVDGALEVNTIM